MTTSRRLRIRRAADIPIRPVTWLWPSRLELGAVNLIAADPGSGKSLLTAAIAATVTLGAPWPDGGRPDPGGVLFLTSEDDPHKATVPRLHAAGADLSRIAFVDAHDPTRPRHTLCIERDITLLSALLAEAGDTRLIVVDPINSYLGGRDANANEQVRAVLEPLARLAESHDVCVLVIKHLNKAALTPGALYRVAGSMAFVEVPRTVHIVATDRTDESHTRQLFLPVKINHGRRPDGLAYEVRTSAVPGLPATQPVVHWLPTTVDADATSALAGVQRPPKRIDLCVDWLRDVLADGPVASDVLFRMAEQAGFNAKLVRKARNRIGAVAEQDRAVGRIGQWRTRLRDETDAELPF